MKSIKDELEKLPVMNDINQSLREEYIKALKNDDFKKLVSTIPMTEDDLMKYTSKLEECSVEHSHCERCKGLVTCKNSIVGYCYTPYASNHKLTFSYDICRYNEALREKNKYQDNALYFDEPQEIKDAKMSEIFKTDKKRLEIIAYLDEFFDTYKKTKKGKGLYLHGSFGSGKTYMVAALFNELAKANIKVAIIYWPEFLRMLKSSFESDFEEKYNHIKKVPLLLIDDIGAENLTPWSRDEILGPILQFRMQEGLSTFFTSNLDLNELETHFSTTSNQIDKVKAKRIMERIRQLTVEKSLVSKNNRG